MDQYLDENNLTTVTTENISATTNFSSHPIQEKSHHLPETIHFTAMGLIIPIGIIFNLLTIVVFARSQRLRKTTTGNYLMALAMADMLFLVGELFRWLNAPNMGHLPVILATALFMDKSNIMCKGVMVLRYATKLASAWITVAITVERFLTVAFPLKIGRISTLKIARVIILLISLVSFGLSLFPIWVVGLKPKSLNRTYCGIINKTLYNRHSWVSLRIGSLLLPGIIVVIFTSLVIIFLHRASQIRRHSLASSSTIMTQTSVTQSNGPTSRRMSRQMSAYSLERQLTIMLICVAITFILLRLPYTIAYYIYLYRENIFTNLSKYVKNNLKIALKMTDIFACINYAVNFFLYCLSGSAFRKEMANVFACKCPYAGRNDIKFQPIMLTNTTATVIKRNE